MALAREERAERTRTSRGGVAEPGEPPGVLDRPELAGVALGGEGGERDDPGAAAWVVPHGAEVGEGVVAHDVPVGLIAQEAGPRQTLLVALPAQAAGLELIDQARPVDQAGRAVV